ncbi:MAG: carbohydrate ABC transporter permease, partial [Gorillibacterium sp.]|nr:carbohydrate ABC transporter permease [Gorillibacterium sp.]
MGMQQASSYRRQSITKNGLIFFFLILLSLTVIFPFLWMVSASLKNLNEVYSYPIQWFPSVFAWGNYAKVLEADFFRYLLNSLKVTLLTASFQLVFSSLSGYSFAKLRFPGRNALFMIYVATMMIPAQVLLIPQFFIIKRLGLFNSHWALILLGSFSAFSVFFMRQYFLTMPQEIIESARIDGCSEFRIFLRLAMPLALPAVATMSVLIIMGTWNDLLNPLIYLMDTQKATIPLGLMRFSTDKGTHMNYV